MGTSCLIRTCKLHHFTFILQWSFKLGIIHSKVFVVLNCIELINIEKTCHKMPTLEIPIRIRLSLSMLPVVHSCILYLCPSTYTICESKYSLYLLWLPIIQGLCPRPHICWYCVRITLGNDLRRSCISSRTEWFTLYSLY